MDGEALEYRPRAWKSLLFLLGTVGGMGVCYWMFARAGAAPFDRMVGAGGMVFFGIGFLIVLRGLVSRRALLRLDREGILVTDYSGRDVVRARWADVVDVYEGTAGSLPVVVLVALDTQAGLSEGATAPLGIDDETGHQTDPGFVINPAPFDVKPEVLVERIYWCLQAAHGEPSD